MSNPYQSPSTDSNDDSIPGRVKLPWYAKAVLVLYLVIAVWAGVAVAAELAHPTHAPWLFAWISGFALVFGVTGVAGWRRAPWAWALLLAPAALVATIQVERAQLALMISPKALVLSHASRLMGAAVIAIGTACMVAACSRRRVRDFYRVEKPSVSVWVLIGVLVTVAVLMRIYGPR